VRALACAVVVALAAVGCGDENEQRRSSSQVSASGFTTERPKGFNGVGTGAVTGVVLGLNGPLERSGGSAPSISVGRSPVPPATARGELFRLAKKQSQAQGARRLTRLPARRIDGEVAAGVRFTATASNKSQTTRRTYAVRRRGFVYTIGSTVPARSGDERPVEAVLDSWKWTP